MLFALLLSLFTQPSAHAFGTSICHLVGQAVDVTYTAGDGQTYTDTLVVGDPADRCPGRCGKSCGPRGIYTMECLQHDACEHRFGTSLGPCKMLGALAAPGFMHGEACSAGDAGPGRGGDDGQDD